jgi:UDP-N-acetylglucosamine:LPS N-acetylglucosamine transferase
MMALQSIISSTPAPAPIPPTSLDSSPMAETEATESKSSKSSVDTQTKALKVLFLSSDTGGGHRASAESLAAQFELLFPGSTYELIDLATEHYPPPYRHIVKQYKHLSANPSHWKIVYGVSNSKALEKPMHDGMIKFISIVSERAIRNKIKSIRPDVVVSVHPLQTSVPILSCAKISHETGQHLPMFTVVTDLGSGHCTWFANGVEKMFVGSSQILELAKDRGKVPDEKLVLLGLPIRHDFAIQAENMGDRYSSPGQVYQQTVRTSLELPCINRKTLLVMGGGEGVGSLSNIVDALYCELAKRNIDGLILVVCGRNQSLKDSLASRNWSQVYETYSQQRRSTTSSRRGFLPRLRNTCGSGALPPLQSGCIEYSGVTSNLRRVLSQGNFSSLMSSGQPLFVPAATSKDEGKDDDDDDDDEPTSNSPPRLHYKSMSFGAIEFEKPVLAGMSTTPSSTAEEEKDEANTLVTAEEESTPESLEESTAMGKVDVVGLGFVTNMAEYMVAADILITKAGPGTISEAAALSLPVLLTSYLPGQEEGNVDYVVDGKFGGFVDDRDPTAVGEEISDWLLSPKKLQQLGKNAGEKGAPHAARDIVQQIGDSTLKWREINLHLQEEKQQQHQEKR